MLSTATLAGGCFWCTEAALEQLAGVHRVLPGYMGGADPAPTYERVCSGTTGHAEVVQVTFDPAVIDYATLLDVFFTIHDPTTLNRQGHDVGSQYRSAIFYHDEAQRQQALATIAELGESDIVDRADAADCNARLEAWRRLATAVHPPADEPVALAWAHARRRYSVPGRYAE